MTGDYLNSDPVGFPTPEIWQTPPPFEQIQEQGRA